MKKRDREFFETVTFGCLVFLVVVVIALCATG